MTPFFAEMKTHAKAFYVLIPMVFLYATSYFQRTAIPGTIFNELSIDLNISAVQTAALGASFICVYSLSQLFVGMFADKYGGIRVITVGGLLFLFGTGLFPFFSNLWVLYGLRILGGIGASSLYLSLVKETDRIFGRKNYSVLLGVILCAGYSGGLFATLPFEQLCARFSWRYVLMAAGGASLLFYCIFLFGKKQIAPSAINPKPISFRPLRAITLNPYSWLLLFCASCNFGIYFIIQTVLGKKFLQDFAGMSSAGAASAVFALTLCCMATLFLTGIISRLAGNRRKPLLIVSTFFCLTGNLLMLCGIYWHLPNWLFTVSYLLYAIASGFSSIFSMAIQEVNSRDILTQSAGFINMFSYMASALGALASGFLLDCFLSSAKVVDKVTIYPQSAYLLLFGIFSLFAVGSFACSFAIPETKGHYFHLQMNRCDG